MSESKTYCQAQEQEGVTKYVLHFTSSPLALDAEQLDAINTTRTALISAGILGCDAARYGGLGFGNLSVRTAAADSRFLISATQTGALPRLSVDQLSCVERSCPESNELWASGASPPSSEAMTHATIYQHCAWVNAVVHVHSPEIWYHGARLQLPATSELIPYGTPEMAEAVLGLLVKTGSAAGPQVFCMKGHQDGVVAYGKTLRECAHELLLLQRHAKAL